LKHLGEKIVDAYKLLGFVDINVILSKDDDRPLREKIHKLIMEAPPTDDTMVEKNFTDNIRRIKEKWYKDQHRQLKLKLTHAQESGNEEILSNLLYEKKELITKERELR
jgi:DNA primase